MGVASLIGRAAKAGKGLLDEANPYLSDNVADMTADQIMMAIKNADSLGLPGWRVNDLMKQLPKTQEVENLAAISDRAGDALNQAAIAGRRADLPPAPPSAAYDPEPLIDWPGESLLSPTPRAPAVPSQAAGSTRYSRRRAIRTAPWADNSQIDRIYETAKQLTDSSGIEHEVDHVIPLRGDYVSGLHHQDNLMIVPKDLNRGKSNLFEVGPDPLRMNDVAR